jgi:hypothetical protein
MSMQVAFPHLQQSFFPSLKASSLWIMCSKVQRTWSLLTKCIKTILEMSHKNISITMATWRKNWCYGVPYCNVCIINILLAMPFFSPYVGNNVHCTIITKCPNIMNYVSVFFLCPFFEWTKSDENVSHFKYKLWSSSSPQFSPPCLWFEIHQVLPNHESIFYQRDCEKPLSLLK